MDDLFDVCEADISILSVQNAAEYQISNPRNRNRMSYNFGYTY